MKKLQISDSVRKANWQDWHFRDTLILRIIELFYLVNFVCFLTGLKTAPFYVPFYPAINLCLASAREANPILAVVLYIACIAVIALVIYMGLRTWEKTSGKLLLDVLPLLCFAIDIIVILAGYTLEERFSYSTVWNPSAAVICETLWLIKCAHLVLSTRKKHL